MSKKKAIAQIELMIEWLTSSYDIRINGYKQVPEIKGKDESHYRDLNDMMLNNIKIQAMMDGFSKGMVAEIPTILKSSYVPVVYELQEWFDDLEALPTAAELTDNIWHTPTIRKYFDTLQLSQPENKEALYRLFQRYLVACVASAYKRKHNDVMLLLVGPQGIYKTSWLENLVPHTLKDRFLYSGHIEPSLTNHNTANYLAEKWFINVDDQLEVIFGKEYNSMKAIISASQITSRRVYAIFDTTRPRIANFMGSVNSTEFLTDHQNRRYFIIEVEKIDPSYTDVRIQDLWREALYIYNNLTSKYIYIKDDYEAINNISRGYTMTSTEEIILRRVFSPAPADYKHHTTPVYMITSEIADILQQYTKSRISLRVLTHALKKNEFEQKNTRLQRFDNEPRRAWLVYTDYDKLPDDIKNSPDLDDLFHDKVMEESGAPF